MVVESYLVAHVLYLYGRGRRSLAYHWDVRLGLDLVVRDFLSFRELLVSSDFSARFMSCTNDAELNQQVATDPALAMC